jgi:hypothetical protein
VNDAVRSTRVASVWNRGDAQAAGLQRWQLRVAGLLLTIERLPEGRWVAVYGGFSRVAGERLSEAIAVAVGARGHEPWVVELAEMIQVESSRNGK